MSSAAYDHLCVHVIDDDEAVRQTVCFLLASANLSTRAYPSADAFLKSMATAPPGCVLTDVRLPGMSGLDLARRIHEDGDLFSVVVMSGFADIPLVIDAMKTGAADFLQKPFTREALVSAVKAALAKPRPTMPAAPDQARYRAVFKSLTPRQMDVLKGILADKPSKVIATELGLSLRTVEGYRSEILAKTQIHSLSELVRTAVLAGLGPAT